MSNLILVRHGESQWNEKGLWTGLTDIGLTEKGKTEAELAGNKIKGLQLILPIPRPCFVQNRHGKKLKACWELMFPPLRLML